jgi:hypothetical protein
MTPHLREEKAGMVHECLQKSKGYRRWGNCTTAFFAVEFVQLVVPATETGLWHRNSWWGANFAYAESNPMDIR